MTTQLCDDTYFDAEHGLMALGLSVIFGVVRVVNFAHGEMMTAMEPLPTTATIAAWKGRARIPVSRACATA